MTAVLMLILAYLLGSIPTAVIAARLRGGVDIRKEGSGNAGATNAARVLGLRVGIAVALIDLAKGLLAVFLVARIAPVADGGSPALCGIAAGAAIAVFPLLAPFCLVIFLVVSALSRWISLASLTAAFVLPGMYLASCLFGAHFDPWKAGFAVALFLFIVMTHRGNIARLIRGEERKLDIERMFRAPK